MQKFEKLNKPQRANSKICGDHNLIADNILGDTSGMVPLAAFSCPWALLFLC